MSEEKHISDEQLKKDFPILFGHSKIKDFEAPKDYFKSLPTNILTRIKDEEKTKVIPISQGLKWKKWTIYACAAAVLVFSITFFFQNESIDPMTSLSFTTEEAALITEEMIADFDEDIFIEAMYSDEFELIEKSDDLEEFIDDIDLEEIIYEL